MFITTCGTSKIYFVSQIHNSSSFCQVSWKSDFCLLAKNTFLRKQKFDVKKLKLNTFIKSIRQLTATLEVLLLCPWLWEKIKTYRDQKRIACFIYREATFKRAKEEEYCSILQSLLNRNNDSQAEPFLYW